MLCLPLPVALAHGSFAGPPGFSSGLLHPLFSPAHLLALVAIALLSGQHGMGRLKRTLAPFGMALLLGLALTLTAINNLPASRPLLVLAGASAILVVLKRPLPSWLTSALAFATAFLVGADSGVAAQSRPLVATTLSGTAITVLALYLYLTAVTAIIHSDRPEWMQIGVRVVGSWIIAIAALILSLALLRP